jgi:hypothetical protein
MSESIEEIRDRAFATVTRLEPQFELEMLTCIRDILVAIRDGDRVAHARASQRGLQVCNYLDWLKAERVKRGLAPSEPDASGVPTSEVTDVVQPVGPCSDPRA